MTDRPMCECLESRSLLSATGVHDLLYVRVQFSDQSGYPESATTASSVANGAAKLIENYSGGKIDFTVATTQVKLAKSSTYYKSAGTGKLSDDAIAALHAAGMSLTKYEHISYRYNGPLGSFAGLGQVGGKLTWIKSSSANVLTHELGHNLGLGHSNLANPKDNSKPFGSFDTSEYGDAYSNMGSGGSKDWEAHQKWSLGWIGGTQVKTVSGTTAGTRTITLSSHDNASTYSSSAVYLVRVTIDSTHAYYVSYRSDVDGIVIVRDAATNPRGGSIIDTHPSTSSGSDAKLNFGSAITDPRGSGNNDDIRISVIRDGTKAKVTIKVGG